MLIRLVGFEHDKSAAHLVRAFVSGGKIAMAAEEAVAMTITCHYAQVAEQTTVLVCVLCDDKKEEASLQESPNGDEKQLKNLTKRVLYLALQKMTGRTLPWGILVGIRPTKLIREMEEAGKTVGDIARVLQEQYYVGDEKLALAMKTYQNERRVLDKVLENEASLYISIPFCPSRCHYCSFVSGGMDAMKHYIPSYLTCLMKEIEAKGTLLKKIGKSIKTIYIGGGTPTVLNVEELEGIFKAINTWVDTKNVVEFTVECGRPDTITKEKLALLKDYGVTRISINPQTMNDKTLEVIGRKHTGKQIVEAFSLARSMGFDDINMDLIAGLEGEGFDDFFNTVEEVLKLAPENITLHTLSLKKGSDLQINKKFTENTEVIVEKMLTFAYTSFIEKEYQPYYLYRQKNILGNFENVSYCKNQKFGIYNVVIMQEYHSIIALGAGGVSKLVEHGSIKRIANPKYPYEYIERIDSIVRNLDKI